MLKRFATRFLVPTMIVLSVFLALPSKAQDALLLYGGSEHKTFLGCLNCSKPDPKSVHNPYGAYGNAYSGTSIFNHFSEYGSSYSSTSACGNYASDPPVIVNQQGQSYGRLTLNLNAPGAVTAKNVVEWLRDVVCGSHGR